MFPTCSLAYTGLRYLKDNHLMHIDVIFNLDFTFRAYKLVGDITIAAPPNTGLGGISGCEPVGLVSPAAILIFGIEV